jgi:hypothetical protein
LIADSSFLPLRWGRSAPLKFGSFQISQQPTCGSVVCGPAGPSGS